jgi:RimJ/RimL family protein N-acetyltransferase
LVVIETERLTLRPLGPSDLDDFLALHADPDVVRFTTGYDRAGAQLRLEEISGEWEQYGFGPMALLERDGGRFLGRCGLKYWPQFDETEVGWSLRPEARGHGYATEAGRACIDWGFRRFPVPYITAMIHPQNGASLRVAERLGLTPLRDDTLLGTPVIVHAVRRPGEGARAA